MNQQLIPAINVLIQAVHVGQKSGAYSIEDSYNIYLAIRLLGQEINKHENTDSKI